MLDESIVFLVFVIFTGAALLATVALYARQSLIVAYILLGALLGPWGLGVISDIDFVREISQFGIIFLLFLLGLDLDPQRMLSMLGKAALITLLSAAAFALTGFGVAQAFGFTLIDSVIIGFTMMFSSTIIGLKLLPTTVLHHKHMGEIIISVLLLQDLLAIVVLIVLNSMGQPGQLLDRLLHAALALPALIIVVVLVERFVLNRLLARFDTIREYIFLVAIGWCLGVAQLALTLGLSYEIGAFIAGVSLASRPIAMFITESLKPLRDFFLILFFFALGAQFNLHALGGIIYPALVLALAALIGKPWFFSWLLKRANEEPKIAQEVGVRLGQVSEFSLLIAMLGAQTGVLSRLASELVQLTMLLTFMVSSYYIVMKFPTPIAVTDRLRRD